MGTAKAFRQASRGRHRAATARSGHNGAAYVGRVGALAVALGIGAAVTGAPGVGGVGDDGPPPEATEWAPPDSGDTPDKPDLGPVIRHNFQDTAANLRK